MAEKKKNTSTKKKSPAKARQTNKKQAKRKKTAKKSNVYFSDIKKGIWGVIILTIIISASLFMVHRFIQPKGAGNVYKTTDPEQPQKPIENKIPNYNPPQNVNDAKRLPKVAIIIDDIGNDYKIAKDFTEIRIPLTFAVLPFSRFRERIINTAKGIEIMLHLPMEPLDYPEINPGKGALFTSMPPDQLIKQLEINLKRIPFVKGVNNHMGSKLTADPDRMNQIFSVLKQRGLFFIDSLTSPESVCWQAAKLFKVPFAQRDVFLDNIQEHEYIRKQIIELICKAQEKGQAIGIGHPYKATYEVLKDMADELRQKTELVTASDLVY